jgi:Flp pilus assembly protein TadB
MIGWTEQQRTHRQSLEQKRTDRSENRMDRGQIFTFVAACLCVTGAIMVGLFGNPYVASVLAIVGIGGPAAATLMAGNNPFSLRRPSTPPPATQPTTRQEPTRNSNGKTG